MDDHEARNYLTFDGRTGSPLRVSIVHPHLSAADRGLLAERIASTDGVAREQALRQIEQFMSIVASIDSLLEAPSERAAEDAAGPVSPEEPLPWACAT